MSSVDKTPSTTLTDPSAMKTTTSEPSLTDWLTWIVTWKPESCTTTESPQLSKGNPSSPSTWQACKHPGTVYHEHSGKGQKRKCQAEGEMDVCSEESTQPLKRLKEEQCERELGCEEPGQGQIRKLQKQAGSQLKPTECTTGPEEEAFTEAKSVDGGKGPNLSYSNIEECIQKYHNGLYPMLLVYLQPSVPERSDSQSSHRIPVDALKKINGWVDGEIHASQTPQIHTDRVSNSILPNPMPTPKAKEKAPEDQGKSPGLDYDPLITADMQTEISSALGPGPKDEILSRAFNMAITREDMRTLRDTQWLNDTVINFYMNLLMVRNQTQGYPALHAFNTFFYTKLKSGGYGSVRRWTKAVNLFEKELILVPVNLDMHWSLVVTNLREKSIVYLDSMGHQRPEVLKLIFHYLQDESKSKRNVDLNPLEWKQYNLPAEEIPQQGNDSDCGMFTCKYADYISRGQAITFSQQHMPLFRKKMVWEILHQCLL